MAPPAGYLSPIGVDPQFFSNAGAVLNAGKIATYLAGTSTATSTYTDGTLGTANPNPIILSSAGRLPAGVFQAAGVPIKVVISDSSNNVLMTIDNIAGVGDPSTAGAPGIGQILFPRTPAETTAGVQPSNYSYPESDIRRYGALTSASDNHVAINTALLVSGSGGQAVYIPPGTWTITSSITFAANASMQGAGNASVIGANNCDGIQFASGSLVTGGLATFLQNLQIKGTGTNAATASTYNGLLWNWSATITAVTFTSAPGMGATSATMTTNWPHTSGQQMFSFSDGEVRNCTVTNGSPNISWVSGLQSAVTVSASYGGRTTGINVLNVNVSNFQTGVFMRGAWNTTFSACSIYNCFTGMLMNGESIQTVITASFFQPFGQTIPNSIAPSITTGLVIQQVDGETTQGTHLYGNQWYGWANAIYAPFSFELHIEHNDISANTSTGVQINNSNGGVWIRDNWIETVNASTITTGINIAALAVPSQVNALHIIGNHLNCDDPVAGSTGIQLGGNNNGAVINDNAVIGFDQGISIGAANNVICKFNRIVVVTPVYSGNSYAIKVTSGTSGAMYPEIGPNYLIPGPSLAASMSNGSANITLPLQAASMTNGSANIGVTNSTNLPVSTAVRFSASVNGFSAGTTYYVVSSASNVIEVSATYGGAPVSATGNSAVNVFAYAPSAFPIGSPVQFSATANGVTLGVTYFVLTSSGNTITIAPYAGGPSISMTGSTAVSAFATPLPVTFSTTSTPLGLSFYGIGKFILTLSGGFATNPSGVVDWVANGKQVAINVNFSSTLDAVTTGNTLTGTGLPPFLLPNTQQLFLATVYNNSVLTYGLGDLAPSGGLTFYASPAVTAFTPSGNKGLNTGPMIWLYT
jgi:hypothetical protein